MPARRDAQVQMETTSGNVQALLRDHLIGRWPETAAEVRRKIAAEAGTGAGAGSSRESIP
jgi:hypothetical protein